MNDWTGRLVIVALLAAIVGVPLALKPAESAKPRTALALVVVTPHNEQIRFEIASAFNRHRQREGKPIVVFDWRSSGGTSDLIKQVIAEYQAEGQRAFDAGREPGGVGYDLFFGGGDFDHNRLAEDIVIKAGGDDGRALRFSCSIPIDLPAGMLKEVFPQDEISGARLYHPDRKWMGVVLASFGIVYNNDRLAQLGLPAPTTWRDLTDERYFGEIALADPAHSGSIAAAYNAVLMRLGWDQGWFVMRRVFANARYFASVSTKVSVDVSAGQAAAGMSIDFYGRFQASAVESADAKGGHRLGYVDPPGMTKQNADPVSLLRGAPHQALAEEFILWLLSKEGQRIWNRKLGAEDGPVKAELRRQPIRRDLYTDEEMKYWTDDIRPFEEAKDFPPGMPDFYRTIATVTQAMAIDVHGELTAAWQAICACEDPARRAAMLEVFDAMPADLTIPGLPADWVAILEEPGHRDHARIAAALKKFTSEMAARWKSSRDAQLLDRQRWRREFRANYLRVVEMAEPR